MYYYYEASLLLRGLQTPAKLMKPKDILWRHSEVNIKRERGLETYYDTQNVLPPTYTFAGPPHILSLARSKLNLYATN